MCVWREWVCSGIRSARVNSGPLLRSFEVPRCIGARGTLRLWHLQTPDPLFLGKLALPNMPVCQAPDVHPSASSSELSFSANPDVTTRHTHSPSHTHHNNRSYLRPRHPELPCFYRFCLLASLYRHRTRGLPRLPERTPSFLDTSQRIRSSRGSPSDNKTAAQALIQICEPCHQHSRG